jgi:hypothetical protein
MAPSHPEEICPVRDAHRGALATVVQQRSAQRASVGDLSSDRPEALTLDADTCVCSTMPNGYPAAQLHELPPTLHRLPARPVLMPAKSLASVGT